MSRSYKSVLTLALRDSHVLTGVVWKNTGTDTIYPYSVLYWLNILQGE